MQIVGIILVLLGSLLSLVAFVCAIIVIVKMFQANQTGLGVGTILALFLCGPIGYILAMVYGWQNKVAWKLEKVMPIFIGSFVLGLLLFIPGYGILIASVAGDFQNQMQMQQNQMQMQMGEMPPINMPQPAPQQ